MPAVSAAPRESARANRTRTRAVEPQLRRYHASVQKAVRAAARVHPHIADLAVSFPALLFCLATAPRAADRGRMIDAVISGETLGVIAAREGLPLWLRKLPPETFTQAIPLLPDDPLFRRQIANHLPDAKCAATWLDSVGHAARWGHTGLAVWIAREITRDKQHAKSLHALNAICVWAWYAAHGPADTSFITRPWHPAMSLDTARTYSEDWRTRVALHHHLGEEKIADVWFQQSMFAGYAFVPLDCAQAIADEAAIMNNCMKTYGSSLAHNHSRLWSIRRNGVRIASFSVIRAGDDPLPFIGEVRLHSNKDAPRELWLIARQWLHNHDLLNLDIKRHDWDTVPLDTKRWHAFWKPYWLAKRSFPSWLPLMPPRDALQVL